MRRAMQYLVDKGVLVRRRRIGTRVVQPKVRRPLGLSSLYEDLESSGQRPSTQVLSLDVEPASAAVAQALALQVDTPVSVLIRLRSAAGRPIARMANYLPHTIPGLAEGLTREALEMRGLYQVIRGLGIQLHAADQVIGARTATAEQARLLGETRSAALLTMQRTAYDDHGRTVEFGHHIYAASRYSLALSMLPGSPDRIHGSDHRGSPGRVRPHSPASRSRSCSAPETRTLRRAHHVWSSRRRHSTRCWQSIPLLAAHGRRS
jgi:GntR family transcriptional regulator